MKSMAIQDQKAFSSQYPDKRYFPRWEAQNRVIYSTENQPLIAYETYTKDLSCSGACIVSAEECRPKQKVKLTIFLSEDTHIELEGIILWVKKQEQGNEIGIQFSNTSQKAQSLILKFAFNLDREKYIQHLFKGWTSN